VIEFEQGRHHGRCILLKEPVLGVVGIVECSANGCLAQFVLTVKDGHDDPVEFAAAIHVFMTEHECAS